MLVQKVIQLTTLQPSRHRVLCLDGIADVCFPPHLDVSVPQHYRPEVYVPDGISRTLASRDLSRKEECILEFGKVRLKR